MSMIRSFVDAVLYPFRMLAQIPSNVISSPRRMLGLSLPVRAALLLFLALVLIVIGWAVSRIMTDDSETVLGFFAREGWPIAILVLVIPLIVWYALKLWLEGEASPYPEIDRTWQAATEAMREQSIDPSETPIFLILGPRTAETASSFMAASNTQFPVRVPTGPAAVHVFANQQSIYIVCTESCHLSRVLGGAAAVPAAAASAAPSTAGFDPHRTMQIGLGGESGGASGPTSPAGGDSMTPPGGTLREDMPAGLADVRVPVPAGGGGPDIRGTMMVGQTGDPAAPPTAAPVTAARLDPSESQEATARLGHVCRLIRKLRDPLCPINGILVATPFGLLADGSQDAVNQLLTAVKSDLECLRTELRMRCSVTHLIDGMEQEAGFRELIRRVGAERAATQRFGKGFGLWNPPTPDQLDALVRHACGAFEDWSYLLFREGEGLSKPGNRHLYALLCRIRSNFRSRLAHLIQSAYGLNPNDTSLASREPLLFSGCYFVANGSRPDRQAFLASVFRKARAEEEELEWGSEAVAEERRMQIGVTLLLVFNGILLALLVAMLVYHFWIRT